MRSIFDAVTRHASGDPDRLALKTRRASYSYAQLAKVVRVRGRELQSTLRPGPVVLQVPRSHTTVVDALALFALGHPVAFVSESASPRSVSTVALEVRAGAVLTPGEAPASLSEPVDVNDLEPLLYFLTSGSTGRPKVVPIGEQSVHVFARWAEDEFCLSTRRVLGFAPMNFDLSLFEIWSVLILGGTVVLADEREATEPSLLRGRVESDHVDLIQAVPFVLASLSEARTQLGKPELAGVEDVIITGGSLAQRVRVEVAQMFSNARFHNVYGATETNDSFIAHLGTVAFAELDELPLGEPLPGVIAEIRDQSGRLVDGVGRGELHVRTPFMMAGYAGEAATVPQDIWSESAGGQRMFRTGDVVRRDGRGVIHLEGRSSRVVKRRGNRISLDQVEVAFSSHPAVGECVAIVAGDGPDVDIAVLVETVDGVSATTLELRLHAATLLPGYAMPSRVLILDHEIPRTVTDKPDRVEVARLLKEMQ